MSDILKNTKKSYFNGEISKEDYIEKIHEEHARMFQYADFIKGTNVKSIHIEEDKVIIETKSESIKLICDFKDKRIVPIEILNFNEYEYDEINILKGLIKEDSVIVDIGANIGYYSLVLGKYNSKGKIYSFEPIPKNFNYLKENIKLNSANNIYPHNIALSDYDGTTSFYFYEEGMANSSMKILNETVANIKVECAVNTLDTFMEIEKVKVDLIKCDTEGSEFLVFKGATKTLLRDKPIIFTEMLRKWSKKFNYHPNDIINFLKGLGYQCFIIENGILSSFDKVTDETTQTNFVFLHTDSIS